MRRLAIPLAVAAGVVLFAAGCGTPTSDQPTPSGGVSSSAGTSPSASAGDDGGVRPATTAPAGLLQAIRTGRHPGYDRLVFEFGGTTAPAHAIRYVDKVTTDPADKPVPLRGSAFLYVVVHGGTLDTTPRVADPSQGQRYTGPTRVTPLLPMLSEAAVAGDFESVLSFGVGVTRPTGITVSTLTAPARLVVDFWHAPRPATWPVSTSAQAATAQAGFDSGHQPWLGSAESVVRQYASAVLHWSGLELRAISPTVYLVRESGGASAVLTAVQPARAGTGGIWAVATVAR